jgi:acyl dehydratase
MSDPVALAAAARAIVWRRYGRIISIYTLNATRFTAVVVDPDTLRQCAEHPSGSGPTIADAVTGLLDALHDVGEPEHDARAEVLRTLADAFPAGVTLAASELADANQRVA